MNEPPRAAARGRARQREPGVRLLGLVPLAALVVLASDLIGITAYPGHATPACDGGIALVMGAAQYDGRPSPALERRLQRALELYRAGCVEAIAVSGGRAPGDRFSEGEAGVRYLRARGVPAESLRAEDEATTSAENLLLSRGYLEGRRTVIVTDDLHAWRTRWLARRFGLDAELATVRAPSGRWRYALRELAALGAYRSGWVR